MLTQKSYIPRVVLNEWMNLHPLRTSLNLAALLQLVKQLHEVVAGLALTTRLLRLLRLLFVVKAAFECFNVILESFKNV